MKNSGYEKQADQITEAPWASQFPLLVSSCLQELPVLDGSGIFLQKCAKKNLKMSFLFSDSLPLLPLSARQLCLVLGLALEYGSLSPLQASSPLPREQQMPIANFTRLLQCNHCGHHSCLHLVLREGKKKTPEKRSFLNSPSSSPVGKLPFPLSGLSL